MTHRELQDILLKSGEFQILYTHVITKHFYLI
jgi:hypothetical protein